MTIADQEPPVTTASTSTSGVVDADPLVPAVLFPYVKAWPPHEQTEVSAYVRLSELLSDEYGSDVHFAAYSRPDTPARLKNEAVPLLASSGGIPMTLLVFDVDHEESHRTKQPAPDSWFDLELSKVAQLNDAHPGLFVARSRGGYRIVLRRDTSFTIRDDDTRAAWTLHYRRSCAYLARTFAIVADPACADWTRLYRAPHATRDKSPERREVLGDPRRVGVWNYAPSTDSLNADIGIATELAKEHVAWKQRVLGPLLREKRPERSELRRQHEVSAGRPRARMGPTSAATGSAREWLAAHPAAIEGAGGDATTYRAALGLVKGWCLLPDQALVLLQEYNARCVPPWTEQALKHKVACALKAPGESGYLLPALNKPVCIITTAEHEVVDAAEIALAERGTFYQRHGALVHVVREGRPQGVAEAGDLVRPPHSPRIVDVSHPRLREELTRIVSWRGQTEKGDLRSVHPPKWLPEELHARGAWRGVPHLEAIVDAPVMRTDGSVLQDPGYDTTTGILYEPNADYLPVSESPTQQDAFGACLSLSEVFEDFPFVDSAHRSAVLAAIITPFAAFAYDGPSPLVAIDAPTAGSGKSLLADAIGVLATGRVMPRMSQAPNEEEERKRITSIALSGERLVLLDNVTRPLGSGALDAALTGDEWSDRLLSTNRFVRTRLRVMWLATANNLQVVGDTARRILNIRLDPKVEHPEQRTSFRHPDLLGWIRHERPRLVNAALTILRAFFAAGAPAACLSGWGSFEGWSRVVRGALVFAGLPDPARTRNMLSGRSDSAAAAFASLLEGLQAFCGEPRDASEIAEYLNKSAYSALRTSFLEIRPLRNGQQLDASAVAYTLRNYRDRIAGSRRLTSVKVGDRHRWQVELQSSTGAMP